VRTRLLGLFLLVHSFVHAAEPDWIQLEKRAIEFLQQYLRIRSISPPADTRETAALFEHNGLLPKVYESGTGQTNLVVRLSGSRCIEETLLLLNHMDVVPVDEKAWNVGPFDGVIRDGQICNLFPICSSVASTTAARATRFLLNSFNF
jgi:acetylornithine deacetylase/succinyl-diaminopimelate desuccinylase-like protein